ncbi:PQQ-dependent sugar dehydrogenase [Chondromyces crocatus]|uniref:Glucose/Sorbosone dehydrogenase domain-containing protein n=1 Tax=Chondromyces crocatus TaxID=52 RepID=A0A0K1EA67_CHOCO|nr:PQQ-dependent sugar dehydrogenase [Chondromyces crocatus]AKT37765.1 uncharacterized protein CMC5_019070 [Chondromyces crocatus]
MMGTKLSLLRLTWIALGAAGAALALNACGGDDGGTNTTSPTGPGGGTTTTTSDGGGGGTGGAGGTGGDGGGTSSLVDCDPATGALPPLKLTVVANGFDRPIFVASEPTDPERLFVVEQRGRIRLIDRGTVQDEPFLDINDVIRPPGGGGDEYGLLGFAFHPNYAANGRFFVYYTYTQGQDLIYAVAEYHRSQSNPDLADKSSGQVIFEIPPGPDHPHYYNHNGGALAFGSDNFLYIGVGDGGSGGDPNNNAQNLARREGKILRIDVDAPQTAPQGNLPGGDPFIWDYGLRNPWRMSFDACNGDLYIGDVGQDRWEEINIERAGQGHKNYGWRLREGDACFNPSMNCPTDGLTPPVVALSHQTDDAVSINGGFVYRGSKIPALRGTYLFGDYSRNWIKSLVWQDGTLVSQGDLTADLESRNTLQAMSSFGQDAAGEVYVVDLAGAIFRIEPE